MPIFVDEEESEFYGVCVEQFLSRTLPGRNSQLVMELGVGSGRAMCHVLERCRFAGVVHGFEIDVESYEAAVANVNRCGLRKTYRVRRRDFFEAVEEHRTATGAIANPPYLPAADARIDGSNLWGGTTGNDIICRLLSCGFPAVMMMIPSYSDPLRVLEYARKLGYTNECWLLQPVGLGRYSRQLRVRTQIEHLAGNNMAFLTRTHYFLAGVTWILGGRGADLSHALESVFRSAGAT